MNLAKAFAYVYHIGIITFTSEYALTPPGWAFALSIGRQRALLSVVFVCVFSCIGMKNSVYIRACLHTSA